MNGLIGAVLPGFSQMPNIHPMVVHFPIALLGAFVAMELLGLLTGSDGVRAAGSWMLYLGALGAAVAVIAGLHAAGTVAHTDAVHAIIERHEGFGISVLVLASGLSLWRLAVRARFSARARAAHIAVAVVMVALMALGADLGGLMVYGHGVGVKAAQTTPAAPAPGHVHDHTHSH